ncbi:MAG: hypothetical protein GX783_09445 [Clostridiales bacterium]|nr:hypothetical protein [Clostridiales bacterium]
MESVVFSADMSFSLIRDGISDWNIFIILLTMNSNILLTITVHLLMQKGVSTAGNVTIEASKETPFIIVFN